MISHCQNFFFCGKAYSGDPLSYKTMLHEGRWLSNLITTGKKEPEKNDKNNPRNQCGRMWEPKLFYVVIVVLLLLVKPGVVMQTRNLKKMIIYSHSWYSTALKKLQTIFQFFMLWQGVTVRIFMHVTESQLNKCWKRFTLAKYPSMCLQICLQVVLCLQPYNISWNFSWCFKPSFWQPREIPNIFALYLMQ